MVNIFKTAARTLEPHQRFGLPPGGAQYGAVGLPGRPGAKKKPPAGAGSFECKASARGRACGRKGQGHCSDTGTCTGLRRSRCSCRRAADSRCGPRPRPCGPTSAPSRATARQPSRHMRHMLGIRWQLFEPANHGADPPARVRRQVRTGRKLMLALGMKTGQHVDDGKRMPTATGHERRRPRRSDKARQLRRIEQCRDLGLVQRRQTQVHDPLERRTLPPLAQLVWLHIGAERQHQHQPVASSADPELANPNSNSSDAGSANCKSSSTMPSMPTPAPDWA